MTNDFRKVTVRANGKCHPAVEVWVDGKKQGGVLICCNCPGSKNGSLTNKASKVSDGHEAANCRK